MAFAFPVAMSIRSSSALKALMIIRAVAAPTPLTVSSNSNNCLSAFVTKPYTSCTSSRIISVINNFTSDG